MGSPGRWSSHGRAVPSGRVPTGDGLLTLEDVSGPVVATTGDGVVRSDSPVAAIGALDGRYLSPTIGTAARGSG